MNFHASTHTYTKKKARLLHTRRPTVLRGVTVRANCTPTPRRAGFGHKISDPKDGGWRLPGIFKVPAVLPCHRLLSISPGQGALSKGILGWTQQMSLFTLDEERPRHGRMSTELMGGENHVSGTCRGLISRLFRFTFRASHTWMSCTCACSVTMPKLEVSSTNTACHLHRALSEDNPVVVSYIF